jgi:Fic-DOC domain mobile mystery protein B
MGLNFQYEKGQTPLSEEEMKGLLIKSITTHGELNEQERLNIEQAISWTLRRKFEGNVILTEQFVRDLHKKMYSDVWRWAGDFRLSEKNIGVDYYQIAVTLKTLLDDTLYWINNKSFSSDEIAIRFKHRIVSIHCFSNGNGRHSRLMADVIIQHIFKEPVFTWSRANLVAAGEARKLYLSSLREADKGDYIDLIKFARS